jgi:hypothetical protein
MRSSVFTRIGGVGEAAGNRRTENRMALLDDMFKGNAMTGVAVGAAALFLGPTILPTIGRALRPVAKTVIKGGIVLYRETVAGIGELTTDLVAEAKSELEHDGHAGLEGPAARAGAANRESPREKN